MKNCKKILILLMVFLLIGGAGFMTQAVMTPYGNFVEADQYFSGATYILPDAGTDIKAVLTADLEQMKNEYNINTVSLYNLENFDDSDSNTNKDILFSELKKLGMKAVVRIENYQASSFTFEDKDIDYIMNYYAKLINYVSSESNREQVAYFALNMPVDDGTVQKNLGGINSEAYLKNQVAYAEKFVTRMRETTQKSGFDNAKMYLSVFYGWDNSYDTPSYTSAKADGYFINNYSYPVNSKKIADENTEEDQLINAETLKKGMIKFSEQYANSPLVIEYGFHTAEYNDGVISDQTAGLVADRAAKEKALLATSKFYSQFPFVKGMMYFGYNLYKKEGSNSLELDWALKDSFIKTVSATSGKLSGGAKVSEDTKSDYKQVVLLPKDKATLKFEKSSGFSQLSVSLKSDADCEIEFYANDALKTTFEITKTDKYISKVINLSCVSDSSISLVMKGKGKVYIESLTALDKIEAENASMNKAGRVSDKKASQQYCASMVKNASLTLEHVRGGSKVIICYKAAKGAVLNITNGGVKTQVTLPAAVEYSEASVKLNITNDSTVEVLNAGENDIRLDYLKIGGIANSVSKENSTDNSGQNISKIIIIIAGVITLISIFCIAVFAIKIKRLR